MVFKVNALIKNSLWLILDKLLVLAGGVLVSILVARYLGPSDFGKITLGITLSGLPLTVSQWGGSQFLFSIAARKKAKAKRYALDSESFRALLYLITTLLIYLVLQNTKYSEDSNFITLVIISQIFLSLDLYQFVFNATFRSKVNARANMLSVVLSNIVRVFLVSFNFKLVFFVIPYFIGGFVLWYKKRRSTINEEKNNYRFSKFGLRGFLLRGRRYVLFTLMSFVSIKVNYIFLAYYFSYQELAIYTVVYMLAYAWLFFPQSIATTLLSKVLASNKYAAVDVSFVLSILTLISFPVVIFTYFFSDIIISMSFGGEYITDVNLLFILVVSSVFSCFNFVLNRVISTSIEGGGYLFRKSVVQFLICTPISFVFIYFWGLKGSAIALLVTELLACTVFNFWYSRGFIITVYEKFLVSIVLFNKYFRVQNGQ
ncbi:oligosaccharide flippase family protein [Vibrio parahaemolyticus]|uniref:oligosaccharide flippase family protein n=1 Tax=Vibrio parahaemolyticus TaxID=670 RepID=UPI0006A65F3A|nr:oligosaccharide flippase family protein [Vibrio parahaemolyticus]EJG1648730.1 oligosaccharide flippase family protein [Vibrio parahaemolyticus]EMA2529755.1 oligosaccharide flippase family protein [Vibrio parahaemolyticus]KOF33499.1 hypothetical protein ACX04_10630 [Vibrio parahaemolyticus]MBM5016208.1 oligosaccharide flippase family protein [Vibrio parahaemolyticus]MCF9105208.1 oligosaccharide flippase family protein [Vibrio parahaemolyticus]